MIDRKFWKDKRVFLTGHTGFKGSWLTIWLNYLGAKVTGFSKKNEVKNLEYVEQNNVKIFIDPKATMFLIGSEMDYMSDKLSSRFVFNNPNEKSSCGCGESFSV